MPAIRRRAQELSFTGREMVGVNAGEVAVREVVATEEDKSVAALLTAMLIELREIKEATKQNGGGRSLIPVYEDFRFGVSGPRLLSE